MNALLKIGLVLLLGASIGFFSPEITSASTTGGYDLSEIEKTSENVSLDSLGALAKEYSIPILIVLVVLSGFSALIGLAFKPMKVVAGSLLGIGILFYILVNFAPQIVGIMMAIIDSIMSRVTGG
ncbi:hypothetical protein WMO40_20670 [Bacillaceae bacterium CLA-AA-H227]|uniref:Uncharacterized protein n=1 Tax=Robertmurraya yapensis (ex Hitch et al 2024) TaxID=3133160 RepID=A0ACC6SG79_9BACI